MWTLGQLVALFGTPGICRCPSPAGGSHHGLLWELTALHHVQFCILCFLFAMGDLSSWLPAPAGCWMLLGIMDSLSNQKPQISSSVSYLAMAFYHRPEKELMHCAVHFCVCTH